MNSSKIKGVILGVMSLALLACDDSKITEIEPEEKIDRLEAKVRKLEAKIDEIDSAFQDVAGSVLKLGFEIEDFSSENWKTNVPDVEYEFEQLTRAVSEVEKKL